MINIKVDILTEIINPVLPLRDIVIFPHMIAPLFVGRIKSINALESVMENNKEIILLTQKKSSVEDPGQKDLYKTGTIGNILQLLKLPDGTVKVLVEGKSRCIIDKIISSDSYLSAKARLINDTKNVIFDYYWGLELHPRCLGVDIKQFTNCRFGMMLWPLLLITYMWYQYRTIGYITNSLLCNCLLQLCYITKFFYWEDGYFSTIDVMIDKAGFYICWGCIAFLPLFYTSHSLYLAYHPIASIEPKAFDHLPNLHELDLSGNAVVQPMKLLLEDTLSMSSAVNFSKLEMGEWENLEDFEPGFLNLNALNTILQHFKFVN